MACCDRIFPQPDPMFRFIDSDEDGPASFWQIPPNERSRRLRVYLLTRAAGESQWWAWAAALSTEPENERYMHQIVDVNLRDDAAIEAFLAEAEKWERDSQATRRVLGS
jgi:hypothetical protein